MDIIEQMLIDEPLMDILKVFNHLDENGQPRLMVLAAVETSLNQVLIRSKQKVVGYSNDELKLLNRRIFEVTQLMKDISSNSPAVLPRKKLKPMIRQTNDGLVLIYELLNSKKITYLDELAAVEAWGLLVSSEFRSDLISNLPDSISGTIKLKSGLKLTKSDFLEKYRKRFE